MSDADRRPEPEPAEPASVHSAAFRIVAIPGDGVGPEVLAAGRTVLDAAAARFGFGFDWTEIVVGGGAIDAYGVPIREEESGTIPAPGSAPSRPCSPCAAGWSCSPTCGP